MADLLMWGFLDCSRYFMSFGMPKIVLDNASMAIGWQEKVGLLAAPGAGKSTIIRLLAGVDSPNSGHVLRDQGGWPLAYGGGFRPEMTAEDNVRMVAGFAGLDADDFAARCAEFAELGDSFFIPLQLYTGAMRTRLAFAVSLGIPARTYLADEKLIAGDADFREKCQAALNQRLEGCGLILVASNPRAMEFACERFAVLSRGKIIMCEDLEEAKSLLTFDLEHGGEEEAIDEELASFDLA
jgi:capsular polysaccharide transport system ATP-binding protein